MTITTDHLPDRQTVTFLELELTRRCPLSCRHCYNDSGPTAEHGAMTTAGWKRIITEAAACGIETVQFIGGEPTAHPGFPQLLQHGLAKGLRVEVFSNLVAIKVAWWDLLTHPRVSLATSYYSDDRDEHEAVTQRRGSHTRTRANIAQAVRRGIPIRVGIIDFGDGQRVAEAEADLRSLGVTRISTDRVRGIGRGAAGEPTVGELCGHCGRGIAAVTADGNVRPCVMSRWMAAGSVMDRPLAPSSPEPPCASSSQRFPIPRPCATRTANRAAATARTARPPRPRPAVRPSATRTPADDDLVHARRAPRRRGDPTGLALARRRRGHAAARFRPPLVGQHRPRRLGPP